MCQRWGRGEFFFSLYFLEFEIGNHMGEGEGEADQQVKGLQ